MDTLNHSNAFNWKQSAKSQKNFRKIDFIEARHPKNGSILQLNGLQNGSSQKTESKKLTQLEPKKNKLDKSLFDINVVTKYERWLKINKPGPGFFNEGNTCYLNSTLQCLMHTAPLSQILIYESDLALDKMNKNVLVNNHQASNTLSRKYILQIYQKLVKEVWSNNSGRSIAPKGMVMTIRRVSKQFRPFRQEDAHEYLRLLLDTMHEEILKVNGIKINSGKLAETTLISRVFGGYLCNLLHCPKCNYVSKTFNHFQDLSLDISSGISSVTNAIEYFTKPEYLSKGNEWKCEKCQNKVKAKKQMVIDSLPPILVLHLKRFSYGNMFGKISKHIGFSPHIEVPCKNVSSGQSPQKVGFDLYGVIVHHGHSTHSGHYIAYVKAANGTWYEMNDSHVSVVSLNRVLSCQAYILFYAKEPIKQLNTNKELTNSSSTSKQTGNTQPLLTNQNIRSQALSPSENINDIGVLVKSKKKDPLSTQPPVFVQSKDEEDQESSQLDQDPKSRKEDAKPTFLSKEQVKYSSSDTSTEEESDNESDSGKFNRLEYPEGFPKGSFLPLRFTGQIGKIVRWSWYGRESIRNLMKKRKLKEAQKNFVEQERIKRLKFVMESQKKRTETLTETSSEPRVAPLPFQKNSRTLDTNIEKNSRKKNLDKNGKDTLVRSSANSKSPHTVNLKSEVNAVSSPSIFQSLVQMGNRGKEVGAEGVWDTVNDSVLQQMQKLSAKQKKEDHKFRSSKKLDTWNQVLDEGRKKKIKSNKEKLSTNHFNQFQSVQDHKNSVR